MHSKRTGMPPSPRASIHESGGVIHLYIGGYATNEPRDFEGDASTGGTGSPLAIYYPKLMQQQHHPLSVCRAVSVRTLTHKLIFRSDPTDADHDSELYDLAKDPRELDNVYGDASYAAVQAALKEKLFIWLMQTSDVTPWLEDPRSGHMPFGPHDIAVDTTPIDHTHVWWQASATAPGSSSSPPVQQHLSREPN